MSYQSVDFRKQSRIPDDIHRMLSSWQRTAKEAIEVRLGRHLQSSLKVELESPIPKMGNEMRLETDGQIAFRADLAELNQPTLFIWDRPMAIALLSETLGEKLTELPADREITDLEIACLDFVVDEFRAAIQSTQNLSPQQSLKPAGMVSMRETHSEFPSNVSNTEVGFQLKLPFGEGLVRWVLPQAATLDLISASPDKLEMDGKARQALEEHLLEAPSELTVMLGHANIPLSTLDALAPGDVLLLDQRITDRLAAQFGGETLFLGWAARSGTKQTFQIDELVNV